MCGSSTRVLSQRPALDLDELAASGPGGDLQQQQAPRGGGVCYDHLRGQGHTDWKIWEIRETKTSPWTCT